MIRDTKSLFESLEQDFGPDAVDMNPRSSTSTVTMVAIDGSRLLCGWFQNGSMSGGVSNPRDVYALTAIPGHATHPRHRILVEQLPTYLAVARVTEVDDHDFLKGYDDKPTIIDARLIGQPAITECIESYAAAALVLNTTEADALGELYGRDVPLEALRARGLELRAMGAGIRYVEL